MKVCHASVEGAQHGPKGLAGFLKFAREAGAAGAQPSNYMLQKPSGGFHSAGIIRQQFADNTLTLDGVSAHCPFWTHTTVWTGSKTIRPFLVGGASRDDSLDQIEQKTETYLLTLLDLCADLGVKVVPMFWGTAYGWEVATGYPWGFWKDPDGSYDLIQEGHDRFVAKTQRLRDHARKLGIYLCHEIHPGTAAQCAEDFLTLVHICNGDVCVVVNGDPSHCWEGEDWERRFLLVGDFVYATHMKNHHIRPGFPLRCMKPDWPSRAMQFTHLDAGRVDLLRYTELMLKIGYVRRYRNLYGTKTAPLVVEAEGAYEGLDTVSAGGIRFVYQRCCFEMAEGSFEQGMGAER